MTGRKYAFGAIWCVPDEKISFPKNIFRRTTHSKRTVIIVENSLLNFNNNEQLIMVAPISHILSEHHNLDILIHPTNINNLDYDSYIRMRALQFIDKDNLKNYIGKIDDLETKTLILETIKTYFNWTC